MSFQKRKKSQDKKPGHVCTVPRNVFAGKCFPRLGLYCIRFFKLYSYFLFLFLFLKKGCLLFLQCYVKFCWGLKYWKNVCGPNLKSNSSPQKPWFCCFLSRPICYFWVCKLEVSFYLIKSRLQENQGNCPSYHISTKIDVNFVLKKCFSLFTLM